MVEGKYRLSYSRALTSRDGRVGASEARNDAIVEVNEAPSLRVLFAYSGGVSSRYASWMVRLIHE